MATLRPYQTEDVQAIVKAFDSHRCVLGRAATGLGKAVELAYLAKLFSEFGRVMVLVDVEKLVRQLAETIQWITGIRPGIEMADERACNGGAGLMGDVIADKIIVSTVQTQYSGRDGEERYRQFNPDDFAAVLLDECELFLAPKARSVVEWYLGNPTLKVYGCTATPMRTDGVAMGELFNHVAFDRDILWGIDQGWLVPAKQAFVRVSLDFSTLKVRKGEDGDKDYSEAEIADRINNESTLIELAKGIIHVAGDRRSIIVCPDVESAKAVTHYLLAERPNCARCVYGEMSSIEKSDTMESHQRGEYQFLASVMMLTKGYDDPKVQAIFNCRKTQSRRLYQQILGRGTRPLRGLLDATSAVDQATERKALIAASPKPYMLMVNMVGVDDSTHDITLVDILGEKCTEAVKQRVKRKMLEQDPGTESDPSREVADAAQAEMKEKEAAEQRERRRVQVNADVEVEIHDDLRVAGGQNASGNPRLDPKHIGILKKAKWPDFMIHKMTPMQAKQLARETVRRWKSSLCSFKQAQALRARGYTKEQLRNMKHDEASAILSQREYAQ